MLGYRVNARIAIETLEQTSPKAAAWWRTTLPDLLGEERDLIFPAEVCRIIKAEPPAPANSP